MLFEYGCGRLSTTTRAAAELRVLLKDHVSGLGGGAANVAGLSKVDEAAVAPVRGPRVLDDGVHGAVGCRREVAHGEDSVVQVVEAVLAGGVVVKTA